MTQRVRRLLFRGGSIVLGGLLAYLALRNVNLSEVSATLQRARYAWIAPLIVIALSSHVVRAWRWQALLGALPEQASHVKLRSAFAAIMIGYMINYALPRVGEFVRSAHLATRERLNLSSVLGTVVIERVIDAITLALGIGISIFWLRDQWAIVNAEIIVPAREAIQQAPAEEVLLFLFGLAAVAFLVWIIGFRPKESPLRRLLSGKLRPLWTSLRDGMATAHRSTRRWALIGSTIIMWLLYGLMAYVPLLIFDMASTYDLTVVDGLIIMFIGAIGVALPTPGGVGSYHYITVVTLGVLYNVPVSLAATYAVFVHGAQLLLYLAVGLIVLILQRARLSQVKGGD